MSKHPDKTLQGLLLLVVGLNSIPHTVDLPPWLIATSMSFLLWTALHLYKGVALPSKWIRTVLTFAGAGGVFLEWHTLLGKEPATGMLVYLATLKLLETTRYRDAMLVIFTSYFLLMAHLLSSQSIASTLFMGIDVMMITALMFQLHKRDRRTSLRSLRPALKLLAVCFPVWIFLFIIFPRFSAGFWKLNASGVPTTGFSDELNPGGISGLVQSDEIAFRVTFKGKSRPSPENMYWRGAVLYFPEGGLQWSRHGQYPPEEPIRPIGRDMGKIYQYEIILEPGFHKWLFALDFPRDLDFDDPVKQNQIKQRPGMIFETNKDPGSLILYQALSTENVPQAVLEPAARDLYLHVPNDIDADIRALAERLHSETNGSFAAITSRVLQWYNDEKFTYTLNPGTLGPNPLSEFLLQKRTGFCEHYAGSYAILMRLMGIPARVVVGFQGAVWNEFGNYYSVRQRDAHAWTEVWNVQTSTWKRIDPTSAIAPLRARLGGDFNFMDPGQLVAGMRPEEITRARLGNSAIRLFMLKSLRAWDAAAMQWTNFLLKYDFDYQQNIFRKMGLSQANRLVFFIWMAIGLIIFVFTMRILLQRHSQKEDPLLAGYHDFCLRLEKAGLRRAPNEGPLDFLDRAKRFRPQQAEELEALTREYIALRYGHGSSPNSQEERREHRGRVRRFEQRIRRFEPQRMSGS